MSSEISQLCLEALSPLAEQCAKNQEKDTPLFIATRHFLKVWCSDVLKHCVQRAYVPLLCWYLTFAGWSLRFTAQTEEVVTNVALFLLSVI